MTDVISHGGTMPAEWMLLPAGSNPGVRLILARTEDGAWPMRVGLGDLSDGPAVFVATTVPHPAGGGLPCVYALPLGPLCQHMVETIVLAARASQRPDDLH